jgi:hypothetical protein
VLGEISENCLWTMEESSSSTRSALSAEEASRCVGNGTYITLQQFRKASGWASWTLHTGSTGIFLTKPSVQQSQNLLRKVWSLTSQALASLTEDVSIGE